jgi:hypothetical protein
MLVLLVKIYHSVIFAMAPTETYLINANVNNQVILKSTKLAKLVTLLALRVPFLLPIIVVSLAKILTPTFITENVCISVLISITQTHLIPAKK